MARDVRDVTDVSAQPTEPQAGSEQIGFGRRLLSGLLDRREASIFIVGVLLIVYFQSTNSAFLSEGNIRTIAQAVGGTAIIAVGLVFVMILGEIDISVGTVFGFAPVVVYLADQQVALGFALVLALGACALVGLINGVLTVFLRIPSFVGTLGTFFILAGLNVILTDGFPKPVPEPQTITDLLGNLAFAGITWALIIVVVFHVILTRTRWGLHTFATGGNIIGASEAGVRINRVKIGNFMLCSILAGFAGIIEAIRISSVDPLAGGGETTFLAVSAAVVGGTALAGGVGTVIGALLGTLVLSILRIGFTLQGVDASYFNVITGAAIIIAMTINVYVARRRQSGRTG